MSGQYKVAWLCEALLVSRSGYYAWLRRPERPGRRASENARLQAQVRAAFAESRNTYGSPRLAQVLGCPGRRNRIARLMHREGLWARQRSKYRVATTDSDHADPIAPNRLLELKAERPDQVWVTDATCVLTGQGWLYVVAVLDVYTRRVLGWSMSDHLDATQMIAALQMAITRRRPRPGLIVHSDRGAQYASSPYRAVLVRHGPACLHEPQGQLLRQRLHRVVLEQPQVRDGLSPQVCDSGRARTALFDYIESFYNRTRLHSSLGFVSPVTFESQLN